MDNAGGGYDWSRSFDKYKEQLTSLLSTGLPIVVFGEKTIEGLVMSFSNATFYLYPKDKFMLDYPFFDRINSIRTSSQWRDQPDATWLRGSPQAQLALYAPIQLNKLLLVQKTVYLNPYKSSRFYWLDAGITKNHEVEALRSMIPKLVKYNKFMFFSHYYPDNQEIHGFRREGVHQYCGIPFVDRIMKGFFWGGVSDKIDEIVSHYTTILKKSLEDGYLGADETIFTILVHQHPDLFDKVMITDCANVMRFL
jgi:hypothetical protein